MSGSAVVPVRRTSYPQVDPRAAGLMHRRFVVVPPGLTVAPAARLAERRRARLVVARIGATWAAASRETLGRAPRPRSRPGAGLGHPLGRPGRAPDRVRGCGPASPGPGPALPPGRRTPRTRRRRRPRAQRAGRAPPFPRPRARPAAGTGGEILRAAGAHGDALGLPVAAVGGLVRDLLLDRADERTDLDLVVEGSAATVARALAKSLGGRPWSTRSSTRRRSSSRTGAG